MQQARVLAAKQRYDDAHAYDERLASESDDISGAERRFDALWSDADAAGRERARSRDSQIRYRYALKERKDVSEMGDSSNDEIGALQSIADILSERYPGDVTPVRQSIRALQQHRLDGVRQWGEAIDSIVSSIHAELNDEGYYPSRDIQGRYDQSDASLDSAKVARDDVFATLGKLVKRAGAQERIAKAAYQRAQDGY